MAESQSQGNVVFVAVGRLDGRKAVVMAQYAFQTELNLDTVHQVLEQPNIANIRPTAHVTFSAGVNDWHVTSDKEGRLFVLICKKGYANRCAFSCLEELERAFIAKTADRSNTARDGELDRTCSSLMQKICAKYDNISEVDKLSSLTNQVDAVKVIMSDSIQTALANVVKLEAIQKESEDLQAQAGVFRTNTKQLKDKMWWKNVKMKLLFAFLVLVILGIIILVILSTTGGLSEKK